MIQTFLALLKVYSEILICPARQTQHLDFIFKGDDFPFLAILCVWHYLLKLLGILKRI